MPISAADAIGPAIEHTKRQLFNRFRLGQWVRLAIVGFLTSGPGGCNFRFPVGGGHPSGGVPLPTVMEAHRLLFFALVAVGIVFACALAIAWMYIASRMTFVLFDSIVEEECHVAEFWRQRGSAAARYFIFQLIYFTAAFVIAMALVSVTVLVAFSLGLFNNARQHVLGLVLLGTALVALFLLFAIVAVVVMVLVRDFVVPQMAIENVTVMEGWNRLWTILEGEKGGFAAYLGLKVLLTVGTGIVIGILELAVVLALLVPFGTAGAIAIFGGHAAGLTWNVYTIAAAITAGLVFFAVLFSLMSFISVPLVVFFPAYAIHFFADRYPPLAQRLRRSPLPQS